MPTMDAAAGRLGVIEAYGLGWRLMKADFWPLWTAALVALLLTTAAGFVPFGQFIAGPPLGAGLFYVLLRRMDGRPVEIGQVFEGFRQRFGQSIVSLLPLLIAWAAVGIVSMAVYFAAVFPVMERSGGPQGPEHFFALFLPFWGAMLALNLIVSLFQLFFIFSLVAVWDYPASGWEAAKVSMRMAAARFWSVLGFGVLAWLILFVANLAGFVLCCVGWLFTFPVAALWIAASIAYLYRSWTGRPLVQPAAEEPFEPTSPVSRGSPFPPRDAMGPPPAGPDRRAGGSPVADRHRAASVMRAAAGTPRLRPGQAPTRRAIRVRLCPNCTRSRLTGPSRAATASSTAWRRRRWRGCLPPASGRPTSRPCRRRSASAAASRSACSGA